MRNHYKQNKIKDIRKPDSIIDHPLHFAIGELIDNHLFPDCKIVKDQACGGEQHIPLFCTIDKSKPNVYCNVDLLIIQNDKIQVIIEIEESTRTPTQICGKFLTSALSSYYIHESENNKPIEMSDSLTFIQIIQTPKQKNSLRPEKWGKIEKSINNILPINGGKVKKYRLIYGEVEDFESSNRGKHKQLITYIKEALK